jgi:hypothetical protein
MDNYIFEKIDGMIVCEESQAITKAFRKRGLIFYSNDIQDCSGGHPEWHIKNDCFQVLHEANMLLMINFLGCHPDCTFLANSGVKNLTSKKEKPGFTWSEEHQIYVNLERWGKMERAAIFLKSLLYCVKTVGHGYVEQPILHKYALGIIGEKPTQIIQPWMFGDPDCKATCLWIVGLPKLIWTDKTNLFQTKTTSDIRNQNIHKKSALAGKGSSKDRKKNRSKTFHGIAEAIAEQWSLYLNKFEKLEAGGQNFKKRSN